jgi:uncharacterized protein (DUF1697 family)
MFTPAIHDALLERPGLDLHVVVVPSRTFRSVVEQNPLAPSEDVHSRLLVAFAQQPAAITALSALTPLVGPTERFFVGGHAAYLLYRRNHDQQVWPPPCSARPARRSHAQLGNGPQAEPDGW